MFRTIPLFATLALGLAACVPVIITDPVDDDACFAAESQYLVGQSANVLAAMTFPVGTRIIYPDTAVTMDFISTRLNIRIGRTGRIEQVYCG